MVTDGYVSFAQGDFSNVGNFWDMPDLVEIDLVDVRSLPPYIFNDLPKLQELTFNASLKSIGQYCFRNMDNLQKIKFPKRDPQSPEFSLSYYVFENTPNLTDVYVEDTAPFEFSFIGDENAFYPTRYTLHVPQGSKELYAAATGWKEFGKIIEDGGSGAGIEDATADTATWRCTAVNGGVTICGAERMEILIATMDGKNVERLTAKTDCTTVHLPAGLYIVSAENHSVKVCVK